MPVNSCVTKIATVSDDSSVIACGYGNGCIHLLDLRLKSPLVSAMTDHQNWVVDIHRQRRSKHLLVSASVAGEIKVRALPYLLGLSPPRLSLSEGGWGGWPHRFCAWKTLDNCFANRLYASPSRNVLLQIWDVRHNNFTNTSVARNIALKRVPPDYGLTAFACHDYSPIFASGSNKEEIRVFNDQVPLMLSKYAMYFSCEIVVSELLLCLLAPQNAL